METTTAAPATSVTAVGLRYGLLIGLVSIVLSFISFTMQWQDSWAMRIASLVVVVNGIVLAQRDFKRRNGGFMSYGQGLGIGVVAGCIIGVLSAVFVYVYATLISPELPAQMIEKARAQMEAKGSYSDEQVDQGMAMAAKFMTVPFLAGTSLFGSIIYALLISLIASAFTKNAQPEFD